MSHCLGDIKEAKFCNQANPAPCGEGKQQGEEPTLFITSVLVCQLSSGRAVHAGRALKEQRIGELKGKTASVGGGEGKVTVKQNKQTNTERKKGERLGSAGGGRTS